MGLTIPKEEEDLCKRLGRPSWAALALTNDLYSWEKECSEAARKGCPHVMNAIHVLMQQHSISEGEAKVLCCEKIRECVRDALRLFDEIRDDERISRDLRAYTEAILYSISGNLVWSIYCPRYHPEETYDQITLPMVTGIDKHV